MIDGFGEKFNLNDEEDSRSESIENETGEDEAGAVECKESADCESTEQMLAAYINDVCGVNSATQMADKETNTECAFLPEKSRARLHERSQALSTSSLSKDGESMDERVVKRSQTFSPSAVVNKCRYVCRLNRSDSDSAMHFAAGHGLGHYSQLSVQNPFHRGAVERRSLRFHHKVPKNISTSKLSLRTQILSDTKLKLYRLCNLTLTALRFL